MRNVVKFKVNHLYRSFFNKVTDLHLAKLIKKEVPEEAISSEFCEKKTEQLFNGTPLGLLTAFIVRGNSTKKNHNTSVCDRSMEIGTHDQDDLRKLFLRETLDWIM